MKHPARSPFHGEIDPDREADAMLHSNEQVSMRTSLNLLGEGDDPEDFGCVRLDDPISIRLFELVFVVKKNHPQLTVSEFDGRDADRLFQGIVKCDVVLPELVRLQLQRLVQNSLCVRL